MRNQFRGEAVPVRVKLAYGVTDLATALPLSTITFFLLFFYTDVIHLSAVLVGQAMLIAKIWDAVSDPLMGQISDRTKSRWGRRRPYLLFGALPYALFFILLWTPGKGLSPTETFLYLIILFILFFTASTIIAVPYNALLPEISLDPHDRTKLSAYRQPFSVIGWVTGSALVPLIVASFSGGRSGYALMAITFGIITLFPLLITFLGVREREEFTRRETLPLLRSFRETLGNAPFWLFIAAYTLISLGYTILSSILIYYAKYWLGNEKIFPVLMGIVMGVLVLSVPLWVFLSGRIGKKWAFIIGTVILIIAAFFFQASPRGMSTSLYVIMVIAGLGTGAYFLLPYAMIPEIVDLDELKTGTRREGAYFGVFFFIFKLSVALAPFIAGYVLHEMGYVPDIEQTEQALLGIRLLVGIIPLTLFSTGIVFLLLFPLTKERYEAVSRELQDRSGGGNAG